MSNTVDDLFVAFGPAPVVSTSGREVRGVGEPSKKRQKTVIDEEERTATVVPTTEGVEEVIVVTYQGEDNCLHECVRPKHSVKEPPGPTVSFNASGVNKNPARTYPYKLDPFQSTAIACLEAGESVLVSAHTSAGKTTVAEYAIAMGLRDKQRVIYTSPIKALSNQKYRDLSDMHGDDVGLLTGDISLNPSASVVIMTTEILRSMLYRGSEMVREMKWIVFDEIHYMRDRERGVVWEETIILLPDTVRLVFLSATIPNAREFAEWICRIKHQPCHVIYTDFRPVPLQHYLFPAGGEGVHLVMDEKKNFREANFHKAVAELNQTVDSAQTDTKAKQSKKSSKNDIEKIVMMCHERNYTPVIIFAFSKREVEANAMGLKKIKLSTDEEEAHIEAIFNNAMDTLGEDRNLPQISCMLPLLKRGIGLHHGGLLPIVKEVIEILFQESLLKVLFSTETFSMGINMPAKTVVFTKLKKWDGASFRMISAGEYIQMSGRAGRRGLDDRGLTVIMFDEKMESEVAKELFLGEPLRIESQFHLGYNMLLNLLRVEGANPEYMIQRSFFQFQQDNKTLKMEKRKNEVEQKVSEMEDITKLIEWPKGETYRNDINQCIADYYEAKHNKEGLEEDLRKIINRPENVLRFLVVGRIVRVKDMNGIDWGYGVVTEQVKKSRPIQKRGPAGFPMHKVEGEYVANVLLQCEDSQQLPHYAKIHKPYTNKDSRRIWEVVPCKLSQITEITQVVASSFQQSPDTPEAKEAAGTIVDQICCDLAGAFPLLDPITHMKLEDPRIPEITGQLTETEELLKSNPIRDFNQLGQLYEKFDEKVKLNNELRELRQELEARKHLAMRDELRAMRRVLRKLDYLDDKNVVTVKGRAACEVSSVDELVMCELLFQNIFHNMDNPHLCAMLSCFVFDEKADVCNPTDQRLITAYEKVREIARLVAEVSAQFKLPISCTEYVDKFKPVLMEIVVKWMNGAKFADLGISEDLFEGSVVRAMRRLEELLRQLACAAKSIGEQDLERRFSQCIQKMRRGIIFSASLYL